MPVNLFRIFHHRLARSHKQFRGVFLQLLGFSNVQNISTLQIIFAVLIG
ncbi:MAG: hypothetical protein HC903_24615 [Methylacidiphilales bacterium]|nr:hypothetical protein [Candidatus Methylacidiphilales bacterium]